MSHASHGRVVPNSYPVAYKEDGRLMSCDLAPEERTGSDPSRRGWTWSRSRALARWMAWRDGSGRVRRYCFIPFSHTRHNVDSRPPGGAVHAAEGSVLVHETTPERRYKGPV
jgi:hypothetical protein